MTGMQTAVLASIWMEFVLATILISTRTASACLIKTGFRWDYFLALLTYALALTANVMNTISVGYGAGIHQHLLSVENMVGAIHWQWITFQTYVIAHMFAKLAIIAFLLEIETDVPTRRKVLLAVVGVINVACNMGTSSLQWQQCKPIAATWDPRIEGVCTGRHRNQMGGYVQGSVGAGVDVFLVMYPVVVFWNMNLDRKVRMGLCALFGVGLLCAACAVLKTISISTLTASDATYQLAVCDIYSLTEMWVALIVGCIPPSKKFWTVALKRMRGNRRSAPGHGHAASYTRSPSDIEQSRRPDIISERKSGSLYHAASAEAAGAQRRGSRARALSKDADAISEESIFAGPDKHRIPEPDLDTEMDAYRDQNRDPDAATDREKKMHTHTYIDKPERAPPPWPTPIDLHVQTRPTSGILLTQTVRVDNEDRSPGSLDDELEEWEEGRGKIESR